MLLENLNARENQVYSEKSIEKIAHFEQLLLQEETKFVECMPTLAEKPALKKFLLDQIHIDEKQAILNQKKQGCVLPLITFHLEDIPRKIKILSLSEFFAIENIIPIIQKVLKPNLTFTIEKTTVKTLPTDLDFTILPLQHPSKDYLHETLLGSELNLYAAPDYLEKHGEPKQLNDLIHHTIIRPQKEDALAKLTHLKYMPIWFKNECIKTDTMSSLLALAEEGIGIICFNDGMIKLKKPKLEKINPLDDALIFPYILSTHKKIKDHFIAKTLRTELHKILH